MISDTISILTDSTLIQTAHLITNDTLIIKVQHCSTSSAAQSTILESVLKNGITILIALVAGFIALLQVKSNVISIARIKWMDDLRNNLGEVCDSAMDTSLNFSNHMDNEKEDLYDDYGKYLLSYSKFTIASSKTILLLDSESNIHSQIETLIEDIDVMLDDENIEETTQDEISTKLDEIIKLSKQVFKKEWKRSKKVFKL